MQSNEVIFYFISLMLTSCRGKDKELYAMKAYWESGGIAPSILDLGTRWR